MSEQAGRWVRVSTTGQDETQQIPDVDAWCDSHGYAYGDHDYVIHGASAHKGNKKFDRMWAQVLSDMRDGRITVLVVWKLDRIDRKLNTFKMLADVADIPGCRVEFVTQPHLNDLTTMGGRIALKVQEEIAYAESADKSDRSRMTQNTIKANGGFRGRPVYGYRVTGTEKNKQLVIVPAEKAIIREAADRYLAGESVNQIADDFNSRGIPAPMYRGKPGKEWYAKTLGGLLRSPSMAGRVMDASGHTMYECEGILTWDEHKRIDERLTSRAHRKGISPGNVALLTSTLFDSEGHPLYTINKGRPSYTYYCRKCHDGVSVELMDSRINGLMANSVKPHMVRTLIPGDSVNEDIAKLSQDITELDPTADGWLDTVTAMSARMAELKAMPRKGSRYELVANGQTEGQWWEGQSIAEQRDYLLSLGLRFVVLSETEWKIVIPESAELAHEVILDRVLGSDSV